jgi:hypothetical protein
VDNEQKFLNPPKVSRVLPQGPHTGIFKVEEVQRKPIQASQIHREQELDKNHTASYKKNLSDSELFTALAYNDNKGI